MQTVRWVRVNRPFSSNWPFRSDRAPSEIFRKNGDIQGHGALLHALPQPGNSAMTRARASAEGLAAKPVESLNATPTLSPKAATAVSLWVEMSSAANRSSAGLLTRISKRLD